MVLPICTICNVGEMCCIVVTLIKELTLGKGSKRMEREAEKKGRFFKFLAISYHSDCPALID